MNALLAIGLVPLYLTAAWVRYRAIEWNRPQMRRWFIASIALALVFAVFYAVTAIVGSPQTMISVGRSLSYLSGLVVWIGTPAASTWSTKHPTET